MKGYDKNNNSITFTDLGLYYFAMIALFFVLSVVGQFIYGAFSDGKGTAFYALNALYSILAMAGVLIYVKNKTGNRITDVVKTHKTKAVYYIFAVILAVGILCGLGSVNSLFSELIKKLGGKITPTVIPLNNAWQYVLFTVVLALFPAVVEECFFRGLILSSLCNGTNKLIASLITALIFAVYHCSFQQLIYQFIYGFLLCFLALNAKSIIPCIVAHFLNNFIILTCEYFSIYVNYYNVLVILFGIILLAFFCAFIIIKSKKERAFEKKKVSGFFIPYGIVAILFCVLTAVLGVI